MLKFRGLRHFVSHFAQKSLNIRTITYQNLNKKSKKEKLCSASILDLENPKSSQPFFEMNKIDFKNYEFPILRLHYDQSDVVNHALSGES